MSHAIRVLTTQMVRDLRSHILVADFAETRKCVLLGECTLKLGKLPLKKAHKRKRKPSRV